MSRNNGNGKWINSYWKGWVRINTPQKSGWYAARPGCCDMTVKLFLEENLYDCYVEGDDFIRNADDFDWWYPLKSPRQSLPEFRE